MERLTTNKDVSEMSVIELAHNSCYAKDRNARYRDFETDIDARELAIKLLGEYADIPNEFTCDEEFDDFMLDSLQYGTDDILGLIAVFYRNLWAMANLRECLKEYENLEEQGKLLKLPCKVGDTFYAILEGKVLHLKFDNCRKNTYVGGIDLYCVNVNRRNDYRWLHLPSDNFFETKEQAEAALQNMKGESE